jgi:hypothetical protein
MEKKVSNIRMRKIRRILDKSLMMRSEKELRRTLKMIENVFDPTEAEWELIEKWLNKGNTKLRKK